VADNIRRICGSGASQSVDQLLEAVGMVEGELHGVLRDFKIDRFESKGTKFNPECQDAIAMIDPPDKESSGKVLDVIVEGYKLGGKLLRAAKVVVGK
jgi:molecular chaperone GrpE